MDISLTGLVDRNALLHGLPEVEVRALSKHLQQVPLVMRQVLHAPGAPIHDVYLLESGIVSLTACAEAGAEVEVGLTGRDGIVGLGAILMPHAVAVHRAFVQVPGTAYRVQSVAFRTVLEHAPVLRDRCLRYVQFMLVQTAQCAACNALHDLPQRMARWLLQARGRLDSDDVPITQEFLSYMLGVRRAGVSVVAGALQAAGLIHQLRGRINLRDVPGLEAYACACYRTVEDGRSAIMGAGA